MGKTIRVTSWERDCKGNVTESERWMTPEEYREYCKPELDEDERAFREDQDSRVTGEIKGPGREHWKLSRWLRGVKARIRRMVAA